MPSNDFGAEEPGNPARDPEGLHRRQGRLPGDGGPSKLSGDDELPFHLLPYLTKSKGAPAGGRGSLELHKVFHRQKGCNVIARLDTGCRSGFSRDAVDRSIKFSTAPYKPAKKAGDKAGARQGTTTTMTKRRIRPVSLASSVRQREPYGMLPIRPIASCQCAADSHGNHCLKSSCPSALLRTGLSSRRDGIARAAPRKPTGSWHSDHGANRIASKSENLRVLMQAFKPRCLFSCLCLVALLAGNVYRRFLCTRLPVPQLHRWLVGIRRLESVLLHAEVRHPEEVGG